jgi:hypothetical protein
LETAFFILFNNKRNVHASNLQTTLFISFFCKHYLFLSIIPKKLGEKPEQPGMQNMINIKLVRQRLKIK